MGGGEIVFGVAITKVEYILIKIPGTKGDIVRYYDLQYEALNNSTKEIIDTLRLIAGKRKNNQYIDYKDISVVVQGAIDKKKTPFGLRSIREFLPGAKIILSTWKGSDYSNLDYDEVLLNDDPGAQIFTIPEAKPKYENSNRQLVSTMEGLKKVKTEYVLKLRSDLMLCGDGITRYLNKDIDYNDDTNRRLFNNKIVIGDLMTTPKFFVKNDLSYPSPFLISDWFLAGKTNDVLQLMDVDLISRNDQSGYNYKWPERMAKLRPYFPYTCRYNIEQYILYSFVKKRYPEIVFEDMTDWNEELVDFSESIIRQNFIVLRSYMHEIVNLKYFDDSLNNNGVFYKYNSFADNSKRYGDN